MADQPRPIRIRLTDGEPYDFGTHTNDFLLRREDALGSEVFLVRVPGRGRVPPHTHPDMEQTFVFTSGVGVAVLTLGKERVEFTCRPGDVVFVPTTWEHTVTANSLEGVTYLTVNAFVPEVCREGETTLGHAGVAHTGFHARQQPFAATAATSVDVHRTAEASFQPVNGRMQGADATAFDATLLAHPSGFRVLRAGPFEYVQDVQPCPRGLSLELGDRLAAASPLPVLVEGSQSPLSVKPPHAGADIDVLVAARAGEDLPVARDTKEKLRGLQPEIPVPLAVGIVHQGWLRLPGFYSAVRLGTGSPDRRWWHASPQERLAEAAGRMAEALAFLRDRAEVERLLHESLAWVGGDPGAIREWRITPRWVGLELLAGPSR